MENQETVQVVENQNMAIGGAKKLDKVSDLFKKTFEVYTNILWKLVGISIIPVITAAIGALLFGLIVASGMNLWFKVVLGIILAIAIVYVSIWSKASLIIAIRDEKMGLSVKDTFKKGKKYIWGYLIVNFLVGFLIIGGSVLFIVPGIILGVFCMFSVFALIDEGKYELDAMFKSFSYVKGNWWGVFGRMLLLGVLFLIASSIPLIGTILSVFFLAPFMMVYAYELYKNLKLIRDDSLDFKMLKVKNTLTVFIVIGVLALFTYISLFRLVLKSTNLLF